MPILLPRIREHGMAMILGCSEIAGRCDFVARGETAEEVLLLIEEHIKNLHGLYEIPHAITDGFRRFIREEALT